eukprot:scaffold117506_cov69-Phaeocystis_antarctica.AAC.1
MRGRAAPAVAARLYRAPRAGGSRALMRTTLGPQPYRARRAAPFASAAANVECKGICRGVGERWGRMAEEHFQHQKGTHAVAFGAQTCSVFPPQT